MINGLSNHLRAFEGQNIKTNTRDLNTLKLLKRINFRKKR